METRETILKELESISPAVANLANINVFIVPQGYFDSFPAIILSRVKSESVVFGEKKEPFNVPSGYFDGLAADILGKIKGKEQSVEEELNELAPLLNTISKKPVYTVPAGYFESLELTIPLKLDKPSARVFSFGRVMQYAVAACMAGILMIGVYLFGTDSSNNEMPISYKEAKNMNVLTELDKLSEAEIASYLESTPTAGYALNVSSEEINLDEYIDAASDEEINAYLNEPAEPVTPGRGI